jgi:molybdopterin synthase catalytic subunit
MKIHVVAFATAAEAIGAGELGIELPEGSSVGDLRRVLEERHPKLVPIWSRLAVAVDGEFGSDGSALSEGCEVALLPPVSGGSAAPRARLVEGDIDPAHLASEMVDPGAGALLVFLGRPRNRTGDRAVSRLSYQAYQPMALAALERIADDLERSHPGLMLRFVHRLGQVEIGEPSVAIAVSSPHRQAAYDASREALERLKREVPIWKREHYEDGDAAWREEEPLTAPALAAVSAGRENEA